MPMPPPKETSKEYQDGFRDALVVIDSTYEFALRKAQQRIIQEVIMSLQRALKNIEVPRFKR